MNPTAVSDLANYLRAHERTIADAWIQAVKGDPEIPSAQKLTPVELSDHLPALFDDLIDCLQAKVPESAARERVRQGAHRHGNQRWNQGYQLIELLRELGIVRQLLLRRGLGGFLKQHTEFSAEGEDARELINQFFEDIINGSVEEYVQKYGAQLNETSHSLADANDRLCKIDAARLA